MHGTVHRKEIKLRLDLISGSGYEISLDLLSDSVRTCKDCKEQGSELKCS